MDKMVRTISSRIDDKMDNYVREVCAAEKIDVSELIKRALDHYRATDRRNFAASLEDSRFELYGYRRDAQGRRG